MNDGGSMGFVILFIMAGLVVMVLLIASVAGVVFFMTRKKNRKDEQWEEQVDTRWDSDDQK